MTDPHRFEDERGIIQDILMGPLGCVTEICTRKGAIRGNHVHKLTTQWTYVVEGLLRVVTETPGGSRTETVYGARSLHCSPAGEAHAWEALDDTVVLVFTRGPRSGADFESDTFREGFHLL